MTRTRALLTLLAVLAAGAATEVVASAAPPTAKPSITAKPSASAAPSAAPPASASAAPAAPSAGDQGALPPGHPSVDGSAAGLPPGHPSMDGDDEDEPSDPRARAGAHGDQGVMRPPEDTAVEDLSLPAGTVVVVVKDAQDKPIPHASISLSAVHNSVAKGERDERFAKDGDDAGSARFDRLAFGTGNAYTVSTTRGRATYTAPVFGLSERAGKRVTVHSYEASENLDDLRVYMKGEVDIGLREDSIVVEQSVGVLNIGQVAWSANAPVALPKGFKAFNKEDTNDDTRVEEVAGSGAAIRGTFPPGQRGLHFRYQVPFEDEVSQTLHIRMPPHMVQARVVVEASRAMSISVAGFPPAERVDGQNGKHYLLTEQQISQKAPELSTLDITLTGLPTPGRGRWVAVAIAVATLLGGIFYFAQTRGGPMDEDARQDMIEAREALLEELVALERAHKEGTVGPKTYSRVRAALLDALARIVAMIPELPAKNRRTEAAR